MKIEAWKIPFEQVKNMKNYYIKSAHKITDATLQRLSKIIAVDETAQNIWANTKFLLFSIILPVCFYLFSSFILLFLLFVVALFPFAVFIHLSHCTGYIYVCSEWVLSCSYRHCGSISSSAISFSLALRVQCSNWKFVSGAWIIHTVLVLNYVH